MSDFAGLEHRPAGILPAPKSILRGVIAIRQTAPEGESDGFATIFLKSNLHGWRARRWLRKHPFQFNVRMYRPEWDEWRDVVLPVRVEFKP